jgi:hypothetical protein
MDIIVAHLRTMTKFSKPENDRKVITKARKCLMCAEPFQSEGPQNRICRKCKSSQTYRDGETPYGL